MVIVALIKNIPCTGFWQWLLLYIQHVIFAFFFLWW